LRGVLIWHVSEPREINRAITRYVVDRVDLLAVRPTFGMQPCRFFNPDSPSWICKGVSQHFYELQTDAMTIVFGALALLSIIANTPDIFLVQPLRSEVCIERAHDTLVSDYSI
jgi:hypothetical protein